MTIPFSLPFGRQRLVLSLDLQPAPARSRRGPDLSAAINATDRELARLNSHSAAAEDRRRWEAQAVYVGLRPR